MSSGHTGVEGFKPSLTVGTGNPEAQKYGKLWDMAKYRDRSPGEQFVPTFLEQAKPKAGSHVLDFGCGTGRVAGFSTAGPPACVISMAIISKGSINFSGKVKGQNVSKKSAPGCVHYLSAATSAHAPPLVMQRMV